MRLITPHRHARASMRRSDYRDGRAVKPEQLCPVCWRALTSSPPSATDLFALPKARTQDLFGDGCRWRSTGNREVRGARAEGRARTRRSLSSSSHSAPGSASARGSSASESQRPRMRSKRIRTLPSFALFSGVVSAPSAGQRLRFGGTPRPRARARGQERELACGVRGFAREERNRGTVG